MNIYEKLMTIQAELKCPKDQFNSFGKYHYRSTESILEGLKPLLEKHKVTLIISDDIKQVGDRYYIKTTVELIDVESEPIQILISTAYAREDETKKGMDLAQVTGSTSSYARKYALNGLFAIDDTKDSDSTNTHGKGQENATSGKVNNLVNAARETYQKHHGDVPIESDDFKCSSCQMDINQAVKTFSEKKYGKTLCIDCQKKVK